MNKRQLAKLGVPEHCANAAVLGIHKAAHDNVLKDIDLKTLIPDVCAHPENHVTHSYFGELAREVISNRDEPVIREPVPYRIWGKEGIEEGSIAQLDQAARLPCAVSAALMPDAHIGYGLPIGGVLALDNAVCPFAVGVDIACRMKLSILDISFSILDDKSERTFEWFEKSLEKGTRFGVGQDYGRSGRQNHDVMDDPRWDSHVYCKTLKDKAWTQLGTSGSGNHFVEFGKITIWEKNELGLEPGNYTGLLSHSGSRGPGSLICKRYSDMARRGLTVRDRERYNQLAWMSLDSEQGLEYWEAMNLMGEFASANHAVIHHKVAKALGAQIITGVENHHNFAWIEEHNGKKVVVHRKGATPADLGVLGVIPGSMANPAYVVRGKGNAESLNSASHGAGRLLSRTQARAKYNFNAVKKSLEKRGIRIISAGADEVPFVYKDIDEVMARQEDLVESIARFDPRIVKMSDDGNAED